MTPAVTKILQMSSGAKDVVKITVEIPIVHDLQARLRLIESFPDYSQILSLPLPPIETLVGPDQSPELARVGNDGMAELIMKYPNHFSGNVASLPMNAPEPAAREAERTLANGANGLQMYTSVNGAPLDEARFLPVFEVAANFNRPIMLHPVGFPNPPDYPTESRSKYEIWHILGWPYQTSVAMARLVFSGIMDRFPELQIVVHHLGAMIPYFGERAGTFWEYRCGRTADEELSSAAERLKKSPADYFRNFYADTALCGARAATICGLEFYGPDHSYLHRTVHLTQRMEGAGYAMEWRYCNRSMLVRKSAKRFAIAMLYVCLVSNQVEVLAVQPHYAATLR